MTDIRISNPSQGPFNAKEKMLRCPNCTGIVIVPMPYGATTQRKQELVMAAIDDHRRVCPAGDDGDGRVYTIQYPR